MRGKVKHPQEKQLRVLFEYHFCKKVLPPHVFLFLLKVQLIFAQKSASFILLQFIFLSFLAFTVASAGHLAIVPMFFRPDFDRAVYTLFAVVAVGVGKAKERAGLGILRHSERDGVSFAYGRLSQVLSPAEVAVEVVPRSTA